MGFDCVWLGNELIIGIFVFWLDNPSTSDYYNVSGMNHHSWPCFYTPRGKPAWNVLEIAYGTESKESNDNDTDNWKIVVIVVVSVAAAYIVFVILFCVYRAKKKRDLTDKSIRLITSDDLN